MKGKTREGLGVAGIVVVALLFVTLMWCFHPGVAQSQTWYPTNQITLAWDPVTTLDGGDPIPAGMTIQYRVYIAPVLDGGGIGTPEQKVVTNTTQQVPITFTVQGKYWVGVMSALMEGQVEVATSTINWSNDPANCQGNVAFGVIYLKIQGPKGLRIP